jgi:hypothetical protein
MAKIRIELLGAGNDFLVLLSAKTTKILGTLISNQLTAGEIGVFHWLAL